MAEQAVHDIENTIEIEFSSEIIRGEGSLETHFHKNFEIITQEKGSCTVSVNGVSHTVSEGQAVIILPFLVHSISLQKEAVIRRTTVGENLGLAFVATDGKKIPRSPIFTPSVSSMRFYSDTMRREFGEKASKYFRVSPPYKRLIVKSMIYLLCSEFMAVSDYLPESAVYSNDLIEQMTKYVTDNYRENISLESMAKEFGYNPQYLSRKLNNTFGINFKRLLNQHRINYAFRLIQDTDLHYSQIAFESGFGSVRTFNQVCIDTFGLTPKELRAKYVSK